MNNKTLPIYLAAAVLLIAGVWLVVQAQNASDNTASQNTNESVNTNTNGAIASNSNTQTVPSATPTSTSPTNTNSGSMNESTTGKFVTLSVKGYGTIKMQMYNQDAPKTVANFLKLSNDGFYNNLTFHRIAQGFVVQGGDPKGDGTGGPGYTIPAEIKRPHIKGAVAMARLGDQVNPNRESSGSQFYIALDDIAQLDGQYTVFAQVVSGMDVVEKIGAAKIQGAGDGPPVTPIVIEKATVSDK